MSDPSPNPSGRPALGLLRENDWEDVVRAVNSLPSMAETQGMDVAVAWGMTELRSVIDLLHLADPRTPEEAKAAPRIHILLTEGFLRVMARPDRAGFNLRRDFLAAVERELLSPTMRTVFTRTTSDTRQPYIPTLGERE